VTTRTTALVTGASSGIGAAVAQVLAERDHDLVLTARREDRLQALKTELEQAHGVGVQLIALDLAQPGGADELYARVKALGTPIGVLVNNAGFGLYGNSLELEPERIRRMLELNVVALTMLTHRFGADMRAAGAGRILQIASVGAFQPTPLYAVYAASKAYVLHMSAAISHELRGSGVSVTTVNPGLTDTEFHERAEHLKPASLDWMQMSARQVAEISVDAMLAGRAVVTPGLVNKLAAAGVKASSRGLATVVSGWLMQGRREP
jgi:short-subunit dehydrogenase